MSMSHENPCQILEFLVPPKLAAQNASSWGIENAQENAICKAKAVIGFAMEALGARPEDEYSMSNAHLITNFLWAADQHLDEIKYLNEVRSEQSKQERGQD